MANKVIKEYQVKLTGKQWRTVTYILETFQQCRECDCCTASDTCEKLKTTDKQIDRIINDIILQTN